MKITRCLPGERAAQTGVIALISFFPLFLTEGYANITATRYFFFTFASAVFLAICLISRIRATDFSSFKKRADNREMTKPDLFLLLFVLVAIVSSFSSEYRLASFSGGGGRRMGLLMILAAFFAYIFISKFYRIRTKEFYWFGVTVIISCLVGLFQFFGFDPLNLLENISRFDFNRFISFSGNINVHASFVCIGTPFVMYMFCYTKNEKDFYFWLVVAVCGFIGFLTCNSDSGYLGIFVAFVALAILSAKERKSFIRFLVLVAVFFLTCSAFALAQKIFEEQARHITFLGKLVTNPAICGPVILTALVLAVFLYFSVFEPSFYKKTQKKIIIAVAGFIGLAVVVIFWFSVVDKETDLGMFNFYFRFNDDWGTDRGYVWIRMLRIFNDFPFYKKLIGCGPDTAVFELLIQYGEEMKKELFYYFDSAHNDLIQYLVTLGIWGVLTYVCLVVTAVRSGLKSDSLCSRAAVLPVIAFFAQACVNINQPITTPLIFVFIAFTQCEKYED